jgi:hypothetical protein
MTGHLGEISVWLEKESNAWLSPEGQGKWGWEEVPYWLKGYVELAYLLDDPAMTEEARVWIEGALASRREDGNFGPVRRFDDDGSQDFWANMVMLACLQTWYDASGDERVIDLMREYFRYQLGVPDELFLTHYWQRMRGGDNLLSVYWLYDRTGEPWLLDLAEKIHRNTADWGLPDDLPNWHNVNIAQGFREPAEYWLLSHDRADLDATYRAFSRVREYYGQVPGGMFGGDENCRAGYDDPRQAIETCGIAEQMLSDEILLRTTADPFWADHCEEVAFNTWPAAFTADYRALRYLTSPNMATSDAISHAPGVENGGPFLLMNPLSHRCCQHNHSHGWTSFTKSLWAATTDGGVCASLYAPCEVTARVGGEGPGTPFTFTVDTRYPFEESVRIQVHAQAEARFPLYLRVPGWCEGATVAINGVAAKPASAMLPGTYLRVERTWKDGDTLELTLPMAISVQRWTANHDSVSVRRGPLTWSLDIAEEHVARRADDLVVHDGRWQPDVDLEAWPAIEILPASPWNYGLVLDEAAPESSFSVERRPWPEDDYPFVQGASPIALRATGRRIPEWALDRYALVAPLQDSPARSSEPDEEITLVPMGAARLRISAFPVIATGDGGHQWIAPVLGKKLYEARASLCYGGDSIDAVCDDELPASSSDQTVPRLTFWPHKGSSEWVQAHFAEPRTVSRVEVYWFDDEAIGGGCRVPASWSVFARRDGQWVRLAPDAPHGTERDRFNALAFAPVETEALRLEVELQEDWSAGVLEWRIE